jgi:hypothetical protein
MKDPALPPDAFAVGKPGPGLLLLAFLIAVAPFVVQTVTLVATKSHAATASAGAAFGVAILAVALHLMARGPGGRKPVPAGSVVGAALAVATYQLLAFFVAHVAATVWFGYALRH